MAKVLILGAGVMGSAIAVPAADNGHHVRLVGTHLDEDIVAALKRDRAAHPRLNAPLPDSIQPLSIAELQPEHFDDSDLVIIGVSSPGIGWACDRLGEMMREPRPIALVTKGLAPQGNAVPLTYLESVPEALRRRGLAVTSIAGIGGPCIARELALRFPSAVVYTAAGAADADGLRRTLETTFYRVEVSEDMVGVEACAALKNFFAIGVSTVMSLHRLAPSDDAAKNPLAALFSQAVTEMARLSEWLGGRRETAYGLAGAGDLHVTVGGGRNSKLGLQLGTGLTVAQALDGPLRGETVEGVDTGRCLAPAFTDATNSGRLDGAAFPLTHALLAALTGDRPFTFDFAQLGRH